MSSYVEKEIRFKSGDTSNYKDVLDRVPPALLSLGITALGAAQVDGRSYDGNVDPAMVSDPGYYESAAGAGSAVVRLVTSVSRFLATPGTHGGAKADPLGMRRDVMIVRELDPSTDGRRCAEILGPARREQSIDALTIRWQQTRDPMAGVFLETTAVHLGARLTNVTDENDQRALFTNVAMPDGTGPDMLALDQALMLSAGNLFDGGVVMADRRPGFEYADQWAQALEYVSRA